MVFYKFYRFCGIQFGKTQLQIIRDLIFTIAGICILIALILLAVQYDDNIQQGPSM